MSDTNTISGKDMNPMLGEAKRQKYPVTDTKIKFQGIANLADNQVQIEIVEPYKCEAGNVTTPAKGTGNEVVDAKVPDAAVDAKVPPVPEANANAANAEVVPPVETVETVDAAVVDANANAKPDAANAVVTEKVPPVVFNEGDKVEANFRGRGKWYQGKISRVRGDGTYDVFYDDDDEEHKVAAGMIRAVTTKPGETEKVGGKTKKRRRRKYRGSAKRRNSRKY